MTDSPAIHVEALRKVYGTKVAVDSLTLQVQRGQVFGFLGPNGAGKTTTIKMMNGLVRPTSGRMSILGKPLGDLEARRRIGFLPEHFRFHEWLRAEEFLDFHASLYGLSRSERRRRIPDALRLVGLEERARSRLRTFSKGMLQRIGIAQAVIADPLLVFLDEPTSALDPLGRRDVRDIIQTLQGRGVTVFLNSHLLGEVERVCDRVAIITEGKVAALGPLQELLVKEHVLDVRATNVTPRLREALGRQYRILDEDGTRRGVELNALANAPTNALTDVATHDGHISIALPEERVPELVDLFVAEGARVYGLTPRQRSLEDLFVDIVQEGGDR